MHRALNTSVLAWLSAISWAALLPAVELDDYFHHTGPAAGTLKSDAPLPIYDADPAHLWNRLFAAIYIRPRAIPEKDGQPAATFYEGGDVIEFLAWTGTDYWSSEPVFHKIDPLLDDFLDHGAGAKQIADPLKRVVFQHDLWAVHDHLIDQNIRRRGDVDTRTRRSALCGKLARCLQQLALSANEIQALPENYSAAIASGAFDAKHDFDASRDYLPHGLLSDRAEWVEVDVYQPETHEDISDRFITLHARSLLGRSHYRIFYRFPAGRQQVVEYLKLLEGQGIDWKRAAQEGFILPQKDAPAIPVGTEVVLLQLMMSLDDQLRPTPTHVVESVQLRVFCNIDGSIEPATNTGVGVNVLDYRLKRHLLFDGLKSGGLEREPEGEPQFRVAIDGLHPRAPDWGFPGKSTLFQQCVECHMSPRLERLGVASIPSIINSGGFDAGAQMGVVHPLDPSQTGVRGERVAKFKSRDESFRRLLEALGR